MKTFTLIVVIGFFAVVIHGAYTLTVQNRPDTRLVLVPGEPLPSEPIECDESELKQLAAENERLQAKCREYEQWSAAMVAYCRERGIQFANKSQQTVQATPQSGLRREARPTAGRRGLFRGRQ